MSELERELFGHYIAHTARTIPFDSAGLSALEVGIPGLALQNRPVFCSLLALAAACKCVDLLDESPEDPNVREVVKELLDFAEARHQESVRLIQVAIDDIKQSTYVLANAAMMVCYGPASHCIQIRLAQGVSPSISRSTSDGLRYVTLTRAPYLAYAGLTFREGTSPRFTKSPQSDTVHSSSSLPTDEDESSSDNVAAESPARQSHPLFPKLQTTYSSALDDLRLRTSCALRSHAHTCAADDSCECDWCACASAFQILNAVFDDVFVHGIETSAGTRRALPDSGPADLAPWLRRFVENAVSTIGVRPLRYTILNFVQRAPAKFVDLVRQELGDDVDVCVRSSNETATSHGLIDRAVSRMALDIFAHWLVLLLLLDEVWWIGPIGDHELGRVTERMDALKSRERWQASWWPDRMHTVYQTLRQP